MSTTPDGPYAFDVFISYARLDREPVERLVRRLEQDGFRVWYDVEQMGRGHTTLGQLADGIACAAHMIACLSDSYIERDFTVFELDTNQSFDPANKQNRTIPVKIRPLTKEVPLQIRAFTLGDLTEPDTYETEYERISGMIQREEPKPEPTQLDRESLQFKCEAPFQHLEEPNVALFQARIAAEAISKFLYRQELGEPPEGSTLDSLIEKLLATRKLPRHIQISLGTVQTYGNFVVKEEMEDYVITQESIQPGLAALRVLSNWTFATYFDQPEEKDVWEAIWSQLPITQDPNERAIPGTKYLLRGPRLSLNSLGALYAGRNKLWRQPVAVNLVTLPKEQDAPFFEEVSRFIRLNDASIIRPLDAGKVIVNGRRLCLYVILEQVDGASAEDLIGHLGPMPALAACEICRGVAASLEGFHGSDPPIVHGDIKPANIIVDRYGRAKVLCIGRNITVSAEEASAGAADGKIDSFLFSSPEQLAGGADLTPKTDLFSLRATLFYLLTGEYEARVRGSVFPATLPQPAAEAVKRLAACSTAQQARQILELACHALVGDGLNLRSVIDCHREGKTLAEASPAPAAPPRRAALTEFTLLQELTVECKGAWPLGHERVLVWESGADTLAIVEGEELLWRDTRPVRLRRVAQGRDNRLAVAGWDGEIRCFAAGGLAATVRLAGAVGDIHYCAGRWIAGTWKRSLAGIADSGEVAPIPPEVEMGVFRIAVMDDSDWFAVADLAGGIAIYSGGRKVANVPPMKLVRSLAFCGRRLVVLSGHSLISVELDGQVGTPERAPGVGNVRLIPYPAPGRCVLLGEDGNSWLIEPSGAHLPYFRFPEGGALLSTCLVPKRFTIAGPEGGCAYWRDGRQQQEWPEAVSAALSADGRFLAVRSPGKVQLYVDPL